ncbi:D-galactarate dehydratase [Sporolactobacillus sp. THM7-4]|nr:D-galactarate dehydratase [Sporolactobacillus sp. THM7-4]
MKSNKKALMLNRKDDIAVALSPLFPGDQVTVKNDTFCKQIDIKEAISFGHKFAVRPISKGEDILKYGEVIGMANSDIGEGCHVHVHNLEGKRGRGDKIDKN